MTALAEVQSALTEFYSQASSPERLAQIQESLITFEQQPSSWMAAIHFLTISSDQYVCLFSLGIIESTVKRRWTLLSNVEKQEIFQFLEKYAFSSEQQHVVTSFLSIAKCKAVKVWTSICKKDFGQVHTQFLARIIGLLTVPASVTTEAGLQTLWLSFSLFKAAYEELLRQDFEISQMKVTENTLLFGRSVPQLLGALFEAAERLLGIDITNSVKALFSDPLGCVSEERFFTVLRFILYFDANLLFSSSTNNLERRVSTLLLKNFSNFLECLSVLLTVSPINAIDHCRLYSLLYIFLIMGSPRILSTLIDASRSRNLSPNVPVDSLAEIGMHSLNCLTEVVDRKDFQRDAMAQHLPFIFRILYWDMLMLDTQFPLPDFASSVINIMAESGVTLSTSTSSNNLSGLASVTQSLESISEDLYQKIVDILRPLVTVFLLFSKSQSEGVGEQEGERGSLYAFSPTKFLQRVHFFTFTVCRSMTPVYLSALDMWNAYLDFVKSFHYGDASNSKKQVQLPSQTQKIISGLCSSLLITIYFSDSATYLDVLDTEYPSGALETEEASSSSGSYLAFFDDTLQQADSSDLMMDHESEYAIFMQTSLTLLSAIAFFNPTTVLHSIAAKFQEGLGIFTQLCNAPERMRLEEHTTRKLHYALRDLATCLNCLAYLSDHFGSLQDVSMLRWLLEALVFNLELGVSFCDRLKTLQVETIQQDVVQVVVENISLLRCLLTSGFVLVSEVGTTASEVSQSYVVLSIADKDAFAISLLQCIHRLLLISPIASLRLHAALLLQALIASSSPPRFSPPAALLSEGAFLADLIACCCEPSRLKAFSIPVQRLLIRAITAYLLTDESPIAILNKTNPKRAEQMQALTAQKSSILINRLIPMFSQALQQDTLSTDRNAYFAGLCWLNEALASLIPLGSKSRRLMYDTLTSSGLLTRIWQCLETTSLSSEVHLFIAHLSFFVQFTDIYGSQRSTASMIPGFITAVMQLLQVLEHNTATARLVSPVISHLLHLLNRLVQNRTVFPTMAIEVLHFVSNCLVVNLAGGVVTDLPSIIATASKNDPDLCLRVFQTLFNTASYAYSRMTAEDEHLATFLRPVLAVFTGEVFDPRLLIACADAMVDLNTRHRIFTLPAFVNHWRNQFARRFLALLFDGGSSVQHGSDSEAALVRLLHGIYCSPEGFAKSDFCETAVEAFLAERIPLVKGQRPVGLTATFSAVAAGDLNTVEEFSTLLSGLLTEMRQWIRGVQSTEETSGKNG
ncbi:unnamed protein product [Hydatigera taeniaeformis]|uniref:Importin N-terminal domain-containing protein n=1 Tax=Hydatigena taeniaeformis TaxID=6205 RepID=A0A0R3WL87_HYDTA|nr:unnamed protein product [Hydatigera taeniaeformis]